MDPNRAPAGDLNDLERRLAEWRPSPGGPDVGRLMFVAGRASARSGRSRMIWPLVSAGLALTAVALGIGLARERGARLELAMQLRAPAPAVAPERGGERGPAESPPTQAPPASYLAARRALTEGLDSWSAADPLVGGGRPESSPRPAVLTSHSPVTLVEP